MVYNNMEVHNIPSTIVILKMLLYYIIITSHAKYIGFYVPPWILPLVFCKNGRNF